MAFSEDYPVPVREYHRIVDGERQKVREHRRRHRRWGKRPKYLPTP